MITVLFNRPHYEPCSSVRPSARPSVCRIAILFYCVSTGRILYPSSYVERQNKDRDDGDNNTDGLPVQRQSPIQVLTVLGVGQLLCSDTAS